MGGPNDNPPTRRSSRFAGSLFSPETKSRASARPRARFARPSDGSARALFSGDGAAAPPRRRPRRASTARRFPPGSNPGRLRTRRVATAVGGDARYRRVGFLGPAATKASRGQRARGVRRRRARLASDAGVSVRAARVRDIPSHVPSHVPVPGVPGVPSRVPDPRRRRQPCSRPGRDRQRDEPRERQRHARVRVKRHEPGKRKRAVSERAKRFREEPFGRRLGETQRRRRRGGSNLRRGGFARTRERRRGVGRFWKFPTPRTKRSRRSRRSRRSASARAAPSFSFSSGNSSFPSFGPSRARPPPRTGPPPPCIHRVPREPPSREARATEAPELRLRRLRLGGSAAARLSASAANTSLSTTFIWSSRDSARNASTTRSAARRSRSRSAARAASASGAAARTPPLRRGKTRRERGRRRGAERECRGGRGGHKRGGRLREARLSRAGVRIGRALAVAGRAGGSASIEVGVAPLPRNLRSRSRRARRYWLGARPRAARPRALGAQGARGALAACIVHGDFRARLALWGRPENRARIISRRNFRRAANEK